MRSVRNFTTERGSVRGKYFTDQQENNKRAFSPE